MRLNPNNITVGRVWDKGSIDCSRSGPLGNPFRMVDEGDRDTVCETYDKWLFNQIRLRNSIILTELSKIYKLAYMQPITLGCYCSPKRCHVESIKKFLISEEAFNILFEE